ncbi:MAG TPA: glycosyltransferase family 4 protein [Vicinamibacterales bacterium]|jgi:glycosyltransferase involved in cell wall biosynthesis|nr:glycosyltransferase family 4 protein [Vicinamibacterales bacterium]
MTRPLRIAQVAPVATAVPPPRSGSIESLTVLLTDGLVAAGHAVTLFATGESRTRATLHATFARGYREDPQNWPWELCEMINISAAIERAAAFDIIHYQAKYHPFALPFGRLAGIPVVITLHHAPNQDEVALWGRHYPDTPFIAISDAQARSMTGLNVVGVVPHAIDVAAFPFTAEPRDYLLFLGRFTEGKGVMQAIEVARRVEIPLVLAAEANDYYREKVAPLVDGTQVVYAGEVADEAKAALLGGARALLYPVQAGEPFGLVLAEATTCGTPVAALARGAVLEVVDDGVTGGVFESLDAMVAGLPRVLALDRAQVRAVAAERFGVARMVAAYEAVYRALAAPTASAPRAVSR